MSTLHSFLPQLTLIASKRRETALNQMEQLHLKWQVPLFKRIKLYSSTSLQKNRTTTKKKLITHLLCGLTDSKLECIYLSLDLFPATFGADCFGFAVLPETFSMLILQTQKNKLSQCLLLWNLAKHSLSGISLGRRQTQKKKTKENKSILLSCIYESICLNIEIMYMLTNLWQNILCKAQYLKLQYLWFGNKTKKNISEGLQNVRLALHQGPVQRLARLVSALQTCNDLQILASCFWQEMDSQNCILQNTEAYWGSRESKKETTMDAEQ